MLSALHLDPIEKKPLFHFAPGSSILSAGFLGCNLSCPFCQNYSISQSTDASTRYVPPEELVSDARDSTGIGIAYTYNEPTVHIEYLLEAASLARDAGLANVLVTNGSILEAPATELLGLIDAVNVDLKAWQRDAYRRLGGDLDTTLRFIELAAERCHVEVTTLVVPGISDDVADIRGIATYLASISREIPFHLSAYRPTYRYHAPATPVAVLRDRRRVANEVLEFVYTGNIADENTTVCGHCGATLVERHGYTVDTTGVSGRACANCGASTPFVYPGS
jgi:pyruvate formate lyase activating enzyme